MRDAFAVLFFVSVGMLLDPGALIASPGLVAGALAIVLVGKPVVALLLVWAMKYPFRTALTVGVALAQIGEFSFILATIGRELGVLTTAATNALVATSIASIVLNPVAYRMIRPLERWLRERPRLWATLESGIIDPVGSQAVPGHARSRSRPSSGGHWIWPDRADGRAIAPRQRYYADGDRAEHGRRARTSGGWRRCDLWGCHASGNTRGGWRRSGRKSHSRLRRHGEQCRSDSYGSRAESSRSCPRTCLVLARCASAEGRRREQCLLWRRRGRAGFYRGHPR